MPPVALGIGLARRTLYRRGAPPTYATLNPSDKSAAISLSGGDLVATSATATWNGVRATVGKSSGKWYYEVSLNATRTGAFANTDAMMGVSRSTHTLAAKYAGEGGLFGWALQDKSPTALAFSPASFPGYTAYSNNAATRYGIYVDLDAGKIYYSFNGTDKGTPTAGPSGTVYPTIWLYDAGAVDPVATCYFDPATWLYGATYPSALPWTA